MNFRAASDRSVLVYLGEEISLAVHERVMRLLRALQKEAPEWLRNIQPAYSSLLITFDARRANHGAVEATVREYAQHAEEEELPKPRQVEIPVCYGGEYGPDLAAVSDAHGLKPADVVKLHNSRTYHAYFLGFAPGFAYLGDLPQEIDTPRLATPRKTVPAGSVGIAGRQTAVYPFATPGGWNLIGRTPVEMFRRDRKPMELVAIGDEVRFRAITPKEFAEWKRT